MEKAVKRRLEQIVRPSLFLLIPQYIHRTVNYSKNVDLISLNVVDNPEWT